MSAALNASDRSAADSFSGAAPIVTFVDLDASQSLLFATEDALPRLSPEDRVRAERRGGDLETLTRWRAARIATRIILERYAGQEIRNVDFVIADGGRPELPQRLPAFSVSHSGSAALVAVANCGAIGIDIEGVRSLTMSGERRQRLVGAARQIGGTSDRLDPDRDGDVLRAWVRLEAVAKARGSGIGRLLTEQGVIAQSTGVRGMTDEADRLAIADLAVPAGYFAAIAAKTLPTHIDVQQFPASAEALARFVANA